MLLNYYKILNVSQKATSEEIKFAYRKLVMLWHPDRNSDPNAHDKIVEINEAYEILSDNSKRQTYDRLNAVMFDTSVVNNYSPNSKQTYKQESNVRETENASSEKNYKDYENLQDWVKEARIHADKIIKEGLKIFEKSLDVSIKVVRKGVDTSTTLFGVLFLLAMGFGSLKYLLELIGGSANFSIVAIVFSIVGVLACIAGIIGMIMKINK